MSKVEGVSPALNRKSRSRKPLPKLGAPVFDSTDSDELIAQGNRVMVPCLRIQEGVEVKWLYESKDIIQFLMRGSTK